MNRVVSGFQMKPFSCAICKKRFATKKSETDHVRLIHENSGNFKCSKCNKTFSCNSNLATHQSTHMREKQFHCHICEKRFISDTSLDRHHREVHSEKKFKCDTCEYAFCTQTQLEKHLIVHSGEKPFKCEKCPKRFARFCQIRRHHQDWHMEKKFKCDQCEMAFGRECSLRSHLVLHLLKPGQWNGKPGRLVKKKMPNLNVHSKKKFNCEQCKQSFYLLSSLESHLASHQNHPTTQRNPSLRHRLSAANDQKKIGANPKIPNGSNHSGGDQVDGHRPELSNTIGAKLKVVFDVEYRAPD